MLPSCLSKGARSSGQEKSAFDEAAAKNKCGAGRGRRVLLVTPRRAAQRWSRSRSNVDALADCARDTKVMPWLDEEESHADHQSLAGSVMFSGAGCRGATSSSWRWPSECGTTPEVRECIPNHNDTPPRRWPMVQKAAWLNLS